MHHPRRRARRVPLSPVSTASDGVSTPQVEPMNAVAVVRPISLAGADETERRAEPAGGAGRSVSPARLRRVCLRS